jgi:hypothetical protein
MTKYLLQWANHFCNHNYRMGPIIRSAWHQKEEVKPGSWIDIIPVTVLFD